MSDDPAASSEAWKDEIPAAPPRRRIRLPQVILSVVVLAALVWSGYWWFATRALQRRIDDEITRLGGTGVTVTCAERHLGGYPFRFDLRCGPFSARAADGSEATLKALTVVSLAYNPMRMILEARDPLTARLADGTSGTLSWRLAHASLDFDYSGLSALSLLIEKPDLQMGGGPSMTAEKAALHTRLRPESKGTDIALSIDTVLLPSLPESGTLAVIAMVEDGGAIARGDTAGFLKDLAGKGVRGRLADVRLSAGGSELKITGPFSVDADGELSGTLQVSLVDPQKLAALLAQGFGIHLPLPDSASLAGLLSGFGNPPVDGRPAMTLPIEVRKGKMMMGFVPLGRMPKVFDPAWFAPN